MSNKQRRSIGPRVVLNGLLLIAILVVGAFGAYAWRALPDTNGRIAVAGLEGELSITRDAEGIPTIRAASPEEAMWGLGFAHAQDRLWQLETHRRIASATSFVTPWQSTWVQLAPGIKPRAADPSR